MSHWRRRNRIRDPATADVNAVRASALTRAALFGPCADVSPANHRDSNAPRPQVVVASDVVAGAATPAIRDAGLAADVRPATGVPFDEAGFPDFAQWRHPDVPDVYIETTETRASDFAWANEAAGLSEPSPVSGHF